jgi:hypothetical protein
VTSPVDPNPGGLLVEVRVEGSAGQAPVRVLRTPNGSLEARLSPEGASVRRPSEPKEPDVLICWPDLALVARALHRWAAVRDSWAAYFLNGHFMCVSPVRWAPGRTTEQATEGPRTQNPWGPTCVRYGGTRELRPRTSPRALAVGLDLIADLWRRESKLGPPEGELVGERWLLDGRQIVDVRRLEARSYHGENLVRWTTKETGIPAELLAFRPTNAGGKGETTLVCF